MSGALTPALTLSLEIALLCAAVLIPCAVVLRGQPRVQGRRMPALALHRAQRDALDRDQAAGLLGPAEHREAGLEIDRRLLAEAALSDTAGASKADTRSDRGVGTRPLPAWPILALLLPVPLLALGLYAIGGHPTLPAQPLANRIMVDQGKQQQDEQLVATLRDTLAQQDPAAPATRQGYMLLGQTEAARGHWAEAAEAWRTVLAQGFDPVVAVEAAEAQSRADRAVSADSAALFRRALAEGSQDAPWRSLAEQRIAQFEHTQDPH